VLFLNLLRQPLAISIVNISGLYGFTVNVKHPYWGHWQKPEPYLVVPSARKHDNFLTVSLARCHLGCRGNPLPVLQKSLYIY